MTRWTGPAALGELPELMRLEVRGSSDVANDMVRGPLKSRLSEVVGLVPGGTPASLDVQVERWGEEIVIPQQNNPPAFQRTEHLQVIFTLSREDGSTVTRNWAEQQTDSPRIRSPGPEGGEFMAATMARSLVDRFLDELLPAHETVRIDFDEADACKSGLQHVKDGNLNLAEETWRAIDAPCAHFNLGVLLEQQAHYEEAQAEYGKDARAADSVTAAKRSAQYAPKKRR